MKKFFGKLLLTLILAVSGLFTVWYFNLDMKLMRSVVLPLLNKHYDSRKIEHTL